MRKRKLNKALILSAILLVLGQSPSGWATQVGPAPTEKSDGPTEAKRSSSAEAAKKGAFAKARELRHHIVQKARQHLQGNLKTAQEREKMAGHLHDIASWDSADANEELARSSEQLKQANERHKIHPSPSNRKKAERADEHHTSKLLEATDAIIKEHKAGQEVQKHRAATQDAHQNLRNFNRVAPLPIHEGQ